MSGTQPAERITAVDLADNVTGSVNRAEARKTGAPHRIVRVLLHNPDNLFLLQKRAAHLENSPGKWDWSANGHVRESETYEQAAHRETAEEIGLTGLKLQWIGKYYSDTRKPGAHVRRFTAIFTTLSTQQPTPDPAEVSELKWLGLNDIARLIARTPDDFTPSFVEIFERFGNAVARATHIPYRPPHTEYLTAVDINDRVTGKVEQNLARRTGVPHRIVRIVLQNPKGEFLIQQRSSTMHDSPLKWDWSVAGHVDAGEDYLECALREVAEEVSVTDAALTFIAKYYRDESHDDLKLRRFHAVFSGVTTQIPHADELEVAQIRWITPADLTAWVAAKPELFTTNFLVIFEHYLSKLKPVDHLSSN